MILEKYSSLVRTKGGCMNEITVVNQNNEVAIDYKNNAIEYLKGMGMNLPQKWANQFIELCKAFSLNPFKRECYAVGYGDNWNIITGYEVYIKRAERTGKLNGWDCKVTGSGNDMVAELTIYRKDWANPFHHYVLFNEAVQKKKDGTVNSMWSKMPSFMLRKVCIAQGFRLCFPDELGGMPYTSDELPEIEKQPTERNITNESSAVKVENVQPVQNETTTNDSADKIKLTKILEQYENQLNGQPFELSCKALAENDPAKISEMLNRCVVYLGKKGI